VSAQTKVKTVMLTGASGPGEYWSRSWQRRIGVALNRTSKSKSSRMRLLSRAGW